MSIANNLYSLPTTGFSYEPSSFQVTGVQRTFSTASVTTTTAPQTYSTPIQARPSSNQVHGKSSAMQQVVSQIMVNCVTSNRIYFLINMF